MAGAARHAGRCRGGRRSPVVRPWPAVGRRRAILHLRPSAGRDGPDPGGGRLGAGGRRVHGAAWPVRDNDEIPGRELPRGSAHRSGHAVRNRMGRPRRRAAGALGARHRRALLRDRALRHVVERLRLDRQADGGRGGRKLSDRRTRLGWRCAGRCRPSLPISNPLGLGQRADAGGRAERLRGGERVAEAVQAHTAEPVGRRTGRRPRPSRSRRMPVQDSRSRVSRQWTQGCSTVDWPP